jgi:hypothetical protein
MPFIALSVFVVVVFFVVLGVVFLAQPGRTTKDNVITIADTTTSTFCLRVVISFPFLIEFPRFAYMRSTLFPFLLPPARGDSHIPIIRTLAPVCQALSPPFRLDHSRTRISWKSMSFVLILATRGVNKIYE